MLSDVPSNPDHAPNKKCNVPASLWLVEQNHRVKISGWLRLVR
jgi:hypothetical protein